MKVIGRKTKEPIFTASSLLATAFQFYESAKMIQSVCPDKPNGTPNLKCFKARYFLLGHAIETGLKAFLFLHGRSIDHLKDLGHNLSGALQEAESFSFSCLNDTEESLITDLNEHYLKKYFEYEEVDYSKLPIMRELQILTGKILKEVKKEIKKNSGYYGDS